MAKPSFIVFNYLFLYSTSLILKSFLKSNASPTGCRPLQKKEKSQHNSFFLPCVLYMRRFQEYPASKSPILPFIFNNYLDYRITFCLKTAAFQTQNFILSI